MSHKKASTDPGKELHLYSRIGMYNEKRLSFFNADGSDYDLASVLVEIGVKKNRGDSDLITLTEGNGITINENDIDFVFTESQSTNFKERVYYWQLRRTISGNTKVWLNGDHDWHNGKFDSFNVNGENITIDDNGSDIIISISDPANPVGNTLQDVLTLGNDGGGFQIKNIADPTAAQDAATKNYVDNQVISVPDATPSVKGIAKLYSDLSASNTDGSVTQAGIKTAVDAKQNSLGFTPENEANKENTTLDTSTTKYPTNRLVKEYVDNATPTIPDASETVKGIAEIATQTETNTGTDDLRFVTPLKLKNQNYLALLASPTFTGTPAAPTAAQGTDSTQIATTAFVQQELLNFYQNQI